MIHFILGGARSGKSRYAEQLAQDYEAQGFNVYYLATAQASYLDDMGQRQLDAEMRQRIEHHQSQRPSHWTTYETPIQLTQTLQQLHHPKHCLLVDCLTLWTLNVLTEKTAVEPDIAALLSFLPQAQGVIIFVSNEVGLGVMPLGELSRLYVDALGRLHQQISHQADQVTFMVAGLPMFLKERANR